MAGNDQPAGWLRQRFAGRADPMQDRRRAELDLASAASATMGQRLNRTQLAATATLMEQVAERLRDEGRAAPAEAPPDTTAVCVICLNVSLSI